MSIDSAVPVAMPSTVNAPEALVGSWREVKGQDHLPDGWRDDGHDHEDEEYGRHAPRHGITFELVTDNRYD